MKKITLVVALLVLGLNMQTKAQNLKGDPWIFQVYKEVYNRQPTAWELNIHNYNSGSWNNYNELKTYVQEYQNSMSRSGITIGFKKMDDNRILAGFLQNSVLKGADIISPQGGNVITAGGANVVAAGGANVITIGGANFQITSNVSGVTHGGRYTTQSTGKTIVPASGKGALIFQ